MFRQTVIRSESPNVETFWLCGECLPFVGTDRHMRSPTVSKDMGIRLPFRHDGRSECQGSVILRAELNHRFPIMAAGGMNNSV